MDKVIAWFKFRLVPNWRDAWSWLSVQMIALAALWESIPDEVKAAVVDPVNQGKVTFWLIVAAGIGRLKDQGGAR